jgi:hypothetical protein
MSSAYESLLARPEVQRFLSRQPFIFIKQAVGSINYVISPELGIGWGPFNGQSARQALFIDIVMRLRPQAIVETGTACGATTELMSQTGLPIFTIEAHPQRFGFARARFWGKRNVKVLYGDSRTVLRKLLGGPSSSLSSGTLLFYLDAHGSEDLPLADEIEIIFDACPAAVVMVDDFEVPSDPGYGYDDYGAGRALTSEYIKPLLLAHRLQAYYPSTPSYADYPSTPMAAVGLRAPGMLRRGCVIVARETCHGAVLASMPQLRPSAQIESIGRQ